MGKKKTEEERPIINPNEWDFLRGAHDYFRQTNGGNYSIDDLNKVNGYLNHFLNYDNHKKPKYKVGLVFVCINQPYWQYALPVVQGVRQFFLPGHDVEIMMWSDLTQYAESKHITYGADTIFETESVGWPYPTLMRYHMFLEQEEYFKKFDYLFYLDLDMRVVNVVGDEILGDGLTMAQHPMYATRQNLWYPYEPNPTSAAYIKQPGRIKTENGKVLFQPLYAAGGFQGGKTQDFIDAMKSMRDGINYDFENNYIARWNDESHWNKYLYEYGMDKCVVLDPSYVYPDSMIKEYYIPIWGRDYVPRVITITKPFTLSKEGGAAAQEMMKTMS